MGSIYLIFASPHQNEPILSKVVEMQTNPSTLSIKQEDKP
jgi:hypothetical protein